MKTMLRSPRISLAIAALAALGACAPSLETHGHRLDPTTLSQVTPGVTSRQEVARLLGSPSSLATFGDDSWYYISQKTETRSFYQSQVEAQDVVRIDFDEAGVVREVKQHGLEMAQAVDPSEERTRTLGNELTIVQQFLGNLGRFNTEESTSRAASAARRGPTGGTFGGASSSAESGRF